MHLQAPILVFPSATFFTPFHPSINMKNDKRTINAWAYFDWANSAYALVITTAIFPSYFLAVTNEKITILGQTMSNSTLYAWSLSLAYIIIAAFSPLLSGIADYGGRKMYFMRFFTLLGSLACIGLLFFTGMPTLWVGVICFILATIGFAGGIVFYNAYLPEISTEDQYDRVSAKGFTYGYIGSILLLITNLAVINNYEAFGFSESIKAVPVAFVMVGLWWIGFSQIPFRRLPPDNKKKTSKAVIKKGYQEIQKVWQVLKKDSMTKRYLLAFFCFNAGVQTVLFLAAIFAEKVLGFATSDLIVLILILQLLAIGGAWIFSRISDKKGNKVALLIMLFLWTAICILGYAIKGTLAVTIAGKEIVAMDFYLLAALVGMVMGGIQSLARSTYAKFFPENTKDTTSFYSFYDVLDKVSTVSGTFIFGLVEIMTDDIRLSMLSLSVFFVVSIMILSTVKVRRMAG